MRLRILSESFITTNCNITNTNKAIICSSVLEKFKNVILDSPGGCIFKLTFQNALFECECIEFVECVEFTAPVNTIILPNQLFDNFLIDFNKEYFLDLDIFVPPQATRVNFKIENTDIFKNPDVKGFLEKGIEKTYKFLYEGQILHIGDIQLLVDKLEPYTIGLISNTDLEVDFECSPEPEAEPESEAEPEAEVEAYSPVLSREDIRAKRLKFYKIT